MVQPTAALMLARRARRGYGGPAGPPAGVAAPRRLTYGPRAKWWDRSRHVTVPVRGGTGHDGGALDTTAARAHRVVRAGARCAPPPPERAGSPHRRKANR
ncbi:protein of unknown function [Modestobacter italicus]|uniref:Uncharacterized protein n=1 Tax=Modestobacter italicus (strain DSM 44449 / CECT 9708 / BC 501) TaxID=2732864 RepID=I4EY15_MODI5|nr:protein of unknown function [Modestobacter marinus]